jgi:pimeloyl-ACP methyl ester carboxylesterase
MKMILLPGLDGTGKLFQPLLEKLPPDMDILVISYPNNKLLSYNELVDYVLLYLPTNEKFILVAESFSGPIAYRISQQKNENLASIVFIATFLEQPRPTISKFLIKFPLKYIFKFSAPIVILRYIFFSNNTDKRILQTFRKILKSIPVETTIYRIQQISILQRALVKVDMNVYYILAKKDKIIPHKVINSFQNIFNKVKIYSLNSEHLVLQSFPMECSDIIINIVNEEKSKICQTNHKNTPFSHPNTPHTTATSINP